MKVIGLTGGIATGKSTVSEILSGLGAEIIDADKIGHEIYLPNTEAWKDIVATFGEDILLPDKTINRPKLGSIVFNDKEALKKLNQIVHSRMYKKFEEEIDKKKKRNNDRGVVVLDAAILIEANWLPLVDQVWVVIADQDTVVDRLCSKKGLTKEHAMSRISSQLSDEERRRYADEVIENNGTIVEVRKRVYEAWKRMIRDSREGGD